MTELSVSTWVIFHLVFEDYCFPYQLFYVSTWRGINPPPHGAYGIGFKLPDSYCSHQAAGSNRLFLGS